MELWQLGLVLEVSWCRRPMQRGTCPAPGCGAPIGGEHHQNVQPSCREPEEWREPYPAQAAALGIYFDRLYLSESQAACLSGVPRAP